MNQDKKVIFLYYWKMLTSVVYDAQYEIVPEYRFGAMACGGTGKGVKARIKAAGLHDWRFDYAFPVLKVAVEVEGGVFVGGGHNRGAYYTDNCNKYNTAASMNWLVFRFTPDMLNDNPDKCIRQVLEGLMAHEASLRKIRITTANANKENALCQS